MYRNGVFILFVLLVSLTSCSKKIAPPYALDTTPTQSQLEWFGMEYYGLIDLGSDTFATNMDVSGLVDSKLFNPTELDTDQWARVCKDAGMSGVILTAKHNDGFCLWPSNQSTYTVRESPWLGGQGDVLKMLSESCRKYGLKLGLYLSVYDMNHPDFGTDRYNEVYLKTIEEVLTNYGDIFEFWYDGKDIASNQKYDWERFDAKIRQLQPQAAINGCRDFRWVFDEDGFAPQTCWATMTRDSITLADIWGESTTLSSRAQGVESGDSWIPVECFVPIVCDSKSYDQEDIPIKGIDQLFDTYVRSVGRNSNLVICIKPDSAGLITKSEANRLKEFKEYVDQCFDKNLALGTKVVSTNSRPDSKYSAAKAINNNTYTYWATEDSVHCASLTFEWLTPQSFNAVMLQEYIALGQRIRSFDIEAMVDNKWVKLTDGTTVGHKRIVTFDRVRSSQIRINITDSRAAITISNVGIYDFPERYVAGSSDGDAASAES